MVKGVAKAKATAGAKSAATAVAGGVAKAGAKSAAKAKAKAGATTTDVASIGSPGDGGCQALAVVAAIPPTIAVAQPKAIPTASDVMFNGNVLCQNCKQWQPFSEVRLTGKQRGLWKCKGCHCKVCCEFPYKACMV